MKEASLQNSPLDRLPTCDTLDGYVADLSQGYHLHGADVLARLQQGVTGGFAGLVLLTLTGEEPTPAAVVRLERALQLASRMDIGEAPCHVARLARIQRAAPHSVASAASINLANRARSILQMSQPLLAWIEDPRQNPLLGERPRRGGEAHQRIDYKRLLRGFQDELLLALQEYEPGMDECLVALLHVSGLTQPWQMEAAMTMAGLPLAMAEAFFAPARLMAYPVNLPRFEYAAGEGDGSCGEAG